MFSGVAAHLLVPIVIRIAPVDAKILAFHQAKLLHLLNHGGLQEPGQGQGVKPNYIPCLATQ